MDEARKDPQVFFDIELSELMDRVNGYKGRGWRFVNLCGSTGGATAGKVELLYSFSSGDELENLRMLVTNEDTVPAISPVYPNAFFFENETHDLYGVAFKGITIDFGGAFYPTSVPTPMNPASLAARQYLDTATSSVDPNEAKELSEPAGEEATHG